MMEARPQWIFVDDSEGEAKSFATRLSEASSPFKVVPVLPEPARAGLLSNKIRPAGVLMDVDLSGAPGPLGTGPGIAQDIRVKQKAGEICEYPVIRFAGATNVARNVKGDPASDDLFDAKIMKEDLLKLGPSEVLARMAGILQVYRELPTFKDLPREEFSRAIGLERERWERFGHPAFADRVLYSLQIALHVASGAFLRSFLLVPGLLIDEALLAVRLGVDMNRSGRYWDVLRSQLDFKYVGVGAVGFTRWWARALDEWWASRPESSSPLSSLTIDERISKLNDWGFKGLVPIKMPQGSAGQKPWRLCCLCLEREPPFVVPIDPNESVRMVGADDQAPWVDPRYASLQSALEEKGDFRLNAADLQRLRRKYPA
jgi:hypothetical protein